MKIHAIPLSSRHVALGNNFSRMPSTCYTSARIPRDITCQLLDQVGLINDEDHLASLQAWKAITVRLSVEIDDGGLMR